MQTDRREAEELIESARKRVASYDRSKFEELASDENILAFVEARTLRFYDKNVSFSQNANSDPVALVITAMLNEYLTDRHFSFDERKLLAARARAELAVLWSMQKDDPSRYKKDTKRMGSIFYDSLTDVEWIGRLVLTATIPGSGKYVLCGILDPALLKDCVRNGIDPDLAVSLS